MTAAPDYAELVRRLRDAAPAYRADERDEAADAIEALAARVAKLEAKDMRFSQREPTAMRARIAALERERDELRADFERYAQHTEVCDWAWAGTQEFKCSCGLDTARQRWSKPHPSDADRPVGYMP